MRMRDIYRKLANKYGVSVEDVKRDMQTAINETYKNPFNTKGIEKYQDIIHCREEIPTVEEFINGISEKIKMEEGNLRSKNNEYI